MRIVKLSVVFLVCACVVLINGCGPELQSLRRQNRALNLNQKKLASELQVARLSRDQKDRQLTAAAEREKIERDMLQLKIMLNS